MSQRITNCKKMYESKRVFAVLISEIELHGYKNESKNYTVLKVFLNSFLMSLKQTVLN